jgi:pimeloyl-ACP methyl ester carboxylesterase
MVEKRKMKNLRTYGRAPFSVAVIHGGPGAAGEMEPVARELASERGVLEPLQTATTLEGQICELKAVLEENGDLPVVLIGFSWGAFLSFLVAARYPTLVEKLILVGSGPFEERYAAEIMNTRMNRLSGSDREVVLALLAALDDPGTADKNTALKRLGMLLAEADAYRPLPSPGSLPACRYDIHQRVWEEARRLRSSGELLEYGKKIRCSVVAIHGDFDPHPYEGVKDPLSRILSDFRFILLEHCGHRPWIEQAARDRFYAILDAELRI